MYENLRLEIVLGVHLNPGDSGKRGGVMFSALDSGSSVPGFEPCFVFLSKTLHCPFSHWCINRPPNLMWGGGGGGQI